MSKIVQQIENNLHSAVTDFLMSGDLCTKTLTKCMKMTVENTVYDLQNMEDSQDVVYLNERLDELNEDIRNLCSVVNLVEESREYHNMMNLLKE